MRAWRATLGRVTNRPVHPVLRPGAPSDDPTAAPPAPGCRPMTGSWRRSDTGRTGGRRGRLGIVGVADGHRRRDRRDAPRRTRCGRFAARPRAGRAGVRASRFGQRRVRGSSDGRRPRRHRPTGRHRLHPAQRSRRLRPLATPSCSSIPPASSNSRGFAGAAARQIAADHRAGDVGGPGTCPDHVAPGGEVLVRVASASSCGPLVVPGIAGCGGPRTLRRPDHDAARCRVAPQTPLRFGRRLGRGPRARPRIRSRSLPTARSTGCCS